jgi:hypothetical protein
MTTGNGQKPKLELQLNKPVKLKLLRDVYTGENQHGKYLLATVQDEQGQEFAWFIPTDLHDVVQDSGLKAGSEIIAQRVENGRKGSSKIQLSILAKTEPPESVHNDHKSIMIESMKEAAEVVAAVPELGFRAEDARAIGLSIYISKSKAY